MCETAEAVITGVIEGPISDISTLDPDTVAELSNGKGDES